MKCKQLPLCDDNLCVRELLLYISETLLEPMPIKVFKNRKPVLFDDVWAGGLTTFARARETGHIYAFGLNNYNQLGKRKISVFTCLLVMKIVCDMILLTVFVFVFCTSGIPGRNEGRSFCLFQVMKIQTWSSNQSCWKISKEKNGYRFLGDSITGRLT